MPDSRYTTPSFLHIQVGRPLHYRDAVAAGIWTIDCTVVYQLVAVVRVSALLPSYVVLQCPLASPKRKIRAWIPPARGAQC